ncbi:MAG: hypothetical protein Ct9H300mP7_3370 [Verrucomicrobiota bacterium]|nr:MAG: hypothetical protein Ct9H300mP7_3370 [Verrucomicrobiota bacterium]
MASVGVGQDRRRHSCGNGVEWWVQYRTSRKVGNLGHGEFEVNGSSAMTAKTVSVQEGEVDPDRYWAQAGQSFVRSDADRHDYHRDWR